MLGKRLVLSIIGLLAAAYLASPYVMLWQFAAALKRSDILTLDQLVDWQSVRQNLKEDIAEGIIGIPRADRAGTNLLPPFGASFISGIAGSEIDRQVTPQRLVSALRASKPTVTSGAQSDAAALPWSVIQWAFFSGPASFVLKVRMPEEDSDAPPVRIRFEIHHHHWKLVRIWLPQEVIEQVTNRT